MTPSPGFAQAFGAAAQLSRALAAERQCSGNGQVAYLRKKQQQLAYVEEAHQQPKPPAEHLAVKQALLSELRRDAADHRPLGSLEVSDKRLLQQQVFLNSRKERHDAALQAFERSMDQLAGSCQAEAAKFANQHRTAQEASENEATRLLAPLEPSDEDKTLKLNAENLDSESKALQELGRQTEGNVREVLAALERLTTRRRNSVEEFAGHLGELDVLDADRRQKSFEMLRNLAEELIKAAHVTSGEVERLVEERTLAVDAVLLENKGAVQSLRAKLLVQVLEQSKALKARWHNGLLLWKRQRHRHSLHLVLQRVWSTEFREPKEVLDFFAKIRDRQAQAFESRRRIAEQLFATPMPKLQVVQVRSLEEQNTALNDQEQEAFDALLADLRERFSFLETRGEQMCQELEQELQRHDARQEWNGHDTIQSFVDAEVRSHLRFQLEGLTTTLRQVADSLSHQEEKQHFVLCRLLLFFLSLARKQEQLKRRVDECEVHYQGEVEDCGKDFEDTCAENEGRMKLVREEINDAVHHDDLDVLKQKAFDQLDSIAVSYRQYTEQVLAIHTKYPVDVGVLIRKEARGFCADLGLSLDAEEEAAAAALEDPEAAAAAAAAAAAPAVAAAPKAATPAAKEKPGGKKGEAPPVVVEAPPPPPLPEFGPGASTGCKVLERQSLAQLREEVAPHSTRAAAEATAEAPEAAVAAEEEATSKTSEEPLLLDGSCALITLIFEEAWLEQRLDETRRTVFEHISDCRRGLDRVDIPAACEEARRELDQRLRRHTNRKGEVQVEWYVPRYSTVAKHKDKFERHLLEVARKCHSQDDAVDQHFNEVSEAETAYISSLKGLEARLSSAESLPVLSSYERMAVVHGAKFKDHCREALAKLQDLATKAPQGLQKENRAFITMCKSSDEGYSESELQFYGSQIEELNRSLEERGIQRAQRAKVLAGQVDEKRQVPLTAFTVAYKQAEEVLCASKGYGRKYGEPRRKAQERCRTLVACGATVRQNIQGLLDYFAALCDLPPPAPNEGPFELASLPKTSSPIRMWEFFKKADAPWTLTGELIGVFAVSVLVLNRLGSHLSAYRQEHAGRYSEKAAPKLRILKDGDALMPPEGQEAAALQAAAAEATAQAAQAAAAAASSVEPEAAGEAAKAKEAALLAAERNLWEDSLLKVLGSLIQSPAFSSEIQAIVKSSQEAYAGQKEGMPDFMQKFLKEMQQSSEQARLEASHGLRAWGNELREASLLKLSDVLFGEATSRAIAELKKTSKEAFSVTVASWAHSEALRASHQQRLNPGLSNPNAEAELKALVDAEAVRHSAALATAAQDRTRMAFALRSAADAHVRRMTALSEQAVLLVDLLPLHGHFSALPGDEQLEPPRMSIKRRIRKIQESGGEEKAAVAADSDSVLPAKSWRGIPRYQLRGLLLSGGWPEDAALQKDGVVDQALLAELMPSLPSFRSKVHRTLFERRSFYYEAFRAEFTAEVARRGAELAARETREQAGEKNWQSMVQQLGG